ncbi:hypothetical protein H2248_005754 [Termitomyces sp. 'cryptogamus']|nr:hypothetical protein H2248_005754 [Termitomyces sp. 'cryptogamus']
MLRKVFSRRTLAIATGGTALAYCCINSGPVQAPQSTLPPPPPSWTPPSRAEMLASLRASAESPDNEFDLLVVGGGATGAGVALDAASRGLKVALVERNDFSSGTSSKSTKLVHGGVRYLQKAVFELDYDQYKLVREALHERHIFLQTAPYLSHMLPIMLPIYKHWQVPYYWAGCKLYDFLAGKQNIQSSYLLSKSRALHSFPTLNPNGLVGAVVYYDGQHNDSRMNIALVLTAIAHGATITNYTALTSLVHPDPTTTTTTSTTPHHLSTALITDTLTSQTFPVRFKCLINATGPHADTLLQLADPDPERAPMVRQSRGVHIALPPYYAPRRMGLIDPKTEDGRVVFLLPWEGGTIAGTTDTPVDAPAPAPAGEEPMAQEEEIRWVLDEVKRCLAPDVGVSRADVLSAWCGLRPLVVGPSASPGGDTPTPTQSLVRSHVIHVSPSGMITIVGGKWTTYREMARETVDTAVRVHGLETRVRSGCVTETLQLIGSAGWETGLYLRLAERYGIETDVARHLADNYGDRAWTICALAESMGIPTPWPRLSPRYPYTTPELHYTLKHEYAHTPTDVLFRRMRLGFLDARAAGEAMGFVVDVMGRERGWAGVGVRGGQGDGRWGWRRGWSVFGRGRGTAEDVEDKGE